MKKILLPILIVSIFSACRSANGPQPGTPATIPNASSEFTYAVTDSSGKTTMEIAHISSIIADTFSVVFEDSVNGYPLGIPKRYAITSEGNLLYLNLLSSCDTTPLPVCTHRTFNGGSVNVPTKLNGYIDSSGVLFRTQYEGEEMVSAAGTNFTCTKVSLTISIISISPNATKNNQSDTEWATNTYWYSPDLGFFVKEEDVNGSSSKTSIVSSMILTAYKQ